MDSPPVIASGNDSLETVLGRRLTGFFDPEWYQIRYPDIAAAQLDPLQHFIRYGASEQRDPNPFFESAWYIRRYADVAASGANPLLHYLTAGAAELRDPNPKFDALYYARQHPEAATNPLLYHLRVGAAQGFLTERPIDVRDYLPSTLPPLRNTNAASVDVLIVIEHTHQKTPSCFSHLLTDRAPPLGRIIVVDDCSSVAKLNEWAAAGQIDLIRNRRRLGFAASIKRGIAATNSNDVVLLGSETVVPAGWLQRLAAHAYSQSYTATVSPFSNLSLHHVLPGEVLPLADGICQTINAGRSVVVPMSAVSCMYIRRDALRAVGGFGTSDPDQPAESEFSRRSMAAGWQHRVACDIFVHSNRDPIEACQAIEPFQFALAAALLRQSKLPVILMISHNLGGGVRRHIDTLSERYRGAAWMVLLEPTDRGANLSIPALPNHPGLTLPPERMGDLVAILRSMNVSRVHLHHLLYMDMDIRGLIALLDVPFDVTVHDYFAICPRINLMMWPEGLYCQEPGPATCNACIADRSAHGARDIVSWRRERAWQFLDADRVICPSVDVRLRLERYGLGERAVVVPHEEEITTTWTVSRPEFAAPPLRIGLLGVLANHKGARTVAEVAAAAAPGTIELHLIGHLEDSFPKAALHLIKTTGKYHERDLPDLLAEISPHVLWFASAWPETYSYTLSSAIETGLPIVATDLGSFPERLAGRPHSWLVDHRASAEVLLRTFDEVRTTLRDRAVPPPVSRPQPPRDFYTHRYLAPEPGNKSARRTKKPKIAVLAEQFASGGFTPGAYIRLLQPLDHPLIGGGFDIVTSDIDTVLGCHADIILTQRCAVGNLATANRLAQHARATGAKLLFDLDDDLLNVPSTHQDAATRRPLAALVRRMLTVADTVWVSTPALADRLATVRPDAVVIADGLDERIWVHGPASHPLWDDPIRILCMGTDMHAGDLALIEPTLVRLKAEYGDRIVIDVLGLTGDSELPAGLNRISPSVHASRSYPGFVSWLTSIRPGWHIGLAPLSDTPLNRSKSPIQAMDYAAMGLTVLASDTPAYRGSIADGPAGQLVANNPIAWHAALDWLIRNEELRHTSALRAHQAFLAGGTLASQADARRAALMRLLPDPTGDGVGDLRAGAAALTISHAKTHPVIRKRRHTARGR